MKNKKGKQQMEPKGSVDARLARIRDKVRAVVAGEVAPGKAIEFVLILAAQDGGDAVVLDVLASTHCAGCAKFYLTRAVVATESAGVCARVAETERRLNQETN